MISHNILRIAARCFCGAGLVLALALTTVLAQTGANTGLAGRVTDPTGALITGATVRLTRVETGEQRILTTNSSGDWEARFLSPGTFRLQFESKGFKKSTREGVIVTTAEMGTVNVRLEVGTVDQTVEVTSNAGMVSSGSATIVRTLNRKELETLPTSARNFTQLLVIEPGVSADISELLSNDNASISPSVNGARTTNNSFVLTESMSPTCSAATAGSMVRGERSTKAAARSRVTSPRRSRRCRRSNCKPASTTRRPAATAAATFRSSPRAAQKIFTEASTTTSRTTS